MSKATKDDGTIGGRIAKLRIDAGLSQKELADELVVERALVNYWENNKRQIKIDDVIKLSTKFRVTCDYILRGIKAENLNVNERTGLSDESVEGLSKIMNDKLYKSKTTCISASDIYNELIQSDRFFIVIKVFSEVVRARKEHEHVQKDAGDVPYSNTPYYSSEKDVLFSDWKLEHHMREWLSESIESFMKKYDPILEKIFIEFADEYDNFFQDEVTKSGSLEDGKHK